MIYYISVATLFFVGYFKKKSRLYLKICFLVLFAFTAFRDVSVGGTDVISYSYFFNNVVPLINEFKLFGGNYSYELGYTFINSIAKTYWGTFASFQVLYSAISTFLLYQVVKLTKLSDSEKCLFLFTYFCFRYFLNAMGLLRQNLANMIIWIALLTIYEKKIKSYLLGLLSIFFHVTSVFNFAIFPIIIAKHKEKFNKKKWVVITIIVSIVCIFFSRSLINPLVEMVIYIGGPRYNHYLIDNNGIAQGFNMINYILRWIFLIIFYISFDKLKYEKKELIFRIACIAIVIGSINVDIVTRMLEYSMIGFYIIMVLSYKLFDEIKDKYIYLSLYYVFFIIILIRNLYTVSAGQYLNYYIMSGG